MKRKNFVVMALLGALLFSGNSYAADTASVLGQTAPLRIAVVSFKVCVEKSKLGLKEQASFETMKKQMEVIIHDKERSLTDVSSKFNDLDYLDSLSQEAEADLKRQYRNLSQEFTQQQNQFYQALNQTNMAIIQKLTDAVTKAAAEVAKANKYDLVLNEESAFFHADKIDVSQMVIKIMDDAFDKAANETKPVSAPK